MSTARVVNGDPLTWLLSPDAIRARAQALGPHRPVGPAGRRPRGPRGAAGRHGDRPRPGHPGRAVARRILGQARRGLRSQIPQQRLERHLSGSAGRRRQRPAGPRGRRVHARAHPLVLRRIHHGRQPEPGHDGAMPSGQPLRRPARPGLAGGPAAGCGPGLAGAQRHRRGHRPRAEPAQDARRATTAAATAVRAFPLLGPEPPALRLGRHQGDAGAGQGAAGHAGRRP